VRFVTHIAPLVLPLMACSSSSDIGERDAATYADSSITNEAANPDSNVTNEEECAEQGGVCVGYGTGEGNGPCGPYFLSASGDGCGYCCPVCPLSDPSDDDCSHPLNICT
jgi:hypothetical protein